ncbi:MAG: hypothetical protein IPP94_09510 [Ignavibacteria bacterium]|nr:hypothetical protein [Ignavibacteria bacterium]
MVLSASLLLAALALALALIALAVYLRGRRRAAAQAPANSPEAMVIVPETASETDEELIAVLAAAATVALRRAVTVKRVQFLSGDSGTLWSVTGRLNIMASHLITKRKF